MLARTVKGLLNKHKKRDTWFLDDYSINPYEGCSCNCLYCYIRGSKYGENMGETLAFKSNAGYLLDKQLALRAAKGEYGFVAVGTATDAYLPQEQELQLTSQLLEILLKHRFPVMISTKRTLISRDIELLKQIDTQAILPIDLRESPGRGLILSTSLSTMNAEISAMLEPGAASPIERLQLVGDLKREGFLVGVNAIPLLPFISDTAEELEKIVATASEHQADYLLAGGLTLFGNENGDSRTLYYKFLERYNTDLIQYYDELYNGHTQPPKSYLAALKRRSDELCSKYYIRTSIV